MKKITEIIIDKHASLLGPRRVDVLKMRYGLKPYNKVHTLKEVSAKYSTTQMRVHEFEKRAMTIITNAIIGD